MTDYTKNLRICLVASAGGHLSQLLKLSQSWSGYDTFFVTTAEVIKEKLSQYGPVYVVGECNRQHLIKLMKVFIHCIKVTLRERPNVVISTGATAGCILCLLAKLARAKVIWIDSIANVEQLSLSGRLVRPFADLFLTQWSDVAKQYNNVQYVGEII